MITIAFGGRSYAIDIKQASIEQLLAAIGLHPELYYITSNGLIIPETTSVSSGEGFRVHPVRSLAPGTGEQALRVLGYPALSGEFSSAHPSGIPVCDVCGHTAMHARRLRASLPDVYILHQCADCWNRDIRARVWATIEWYGLLTHSRRVCLALSGEKDSAMSLALITDYLRETDQPVELVSVTVDPGIDGYSARRVQRAVQLAADHRVRLSIIPFGEQFGATLDELVTLSLKRRLSLRPCIICDTLVRKTISRAAITINADTVIGGRNATDIEADILQDMYTGRSTSLAVY